MKDFIAKKIQSFKRDTLIIYFSARDSRMPVVVRILAFLLAAYALSPIDLIPDFIPVFGLLDELILLPLGFKLIMRLTPAEVIESSTLKAQQMMERPVSYGAAIYIIAVWLLVGVIIFNHWA